MNTITLRLVPVSHSHQVDQKYGQAQCEQERLERSGHFFALPGNVHRQTVGHLHVRQQGFRLTGCVAQVAISDIGLHQGQALLVAAANLRRTLGDANFRHG
jgi:hypothetical protein